MRVIKVKELSLESINALKKGRKSGTDMRYRTISHKCRFQSTLLYPKMQTLNKVQPATTFTFCFNYIILVQHRL